MTTNAILAMNRPSTMPALKTNKPTRVSCRLNDDLCWNAVLARRRTHDGEFVFAVSSTGVYCRPSCPARRPRRENVKFFREPDQAERAGYRACLRCRPKAIGGNGTTEMVKAMCRYIEQHLDEPLTLARLGSAFHPSPF